MVAEVDDLVLPRVVAVGIGQSPFVGQHALYLFDASIGKSLVVEEHLADVPFAVLVEAGGAVVTSPEGYASIGGGHDGSGVIKIILGATITFLHAFHPVVANGPDVVLAVLLVDVGAGGGIVGAGGASHGHGHAVVSASCAELPALPAVSALGDHGTPGAGVAVAFGNHEEGEALERVEGVAVVVGEGEVVVVEVNGGQAVLLVGLEMRFLAGRSQVGGVGVVALAGLVSPEEDGTVVARILDHDRACHGITEVAVAAAVDGGDFGLGQGACVDASVVDELGEALVAVPVVAHGVDGFPRGPISVALEGAVVVDEGLVGGTVRYCDDVVPSARGVGNLEVPARITEIAVAVGVDADVVVAASDD